ncbi:hypothetical protein [Granulosicoccus antarcticus]|uniref:hypothetical protein n=1 Tax=Granulosicoccus antarcticus TaxID=437505 RepID=UPI00146FB1CD|nr:hypothetical protein [Granulosicoccus antarcticus]
MAVAVAGTLSLMASTAQAAEFTASTTLQNTLAVTAISPLDIGTVFAASTGADIGDGVGVMNIAGDGTVDYTNSSTTIKLMSLGTPVPAQGSVDSASDFKLILPDTNLFLATTFADGSGTLEAAFSDANLGNAGYEAVELRVSADDTIPALYLVHFKVGDVSGGAASEDGTANDGIWDVDMDFGETTYVFNIGATVVTQPGIESATGAADGDLAYEEGTYSGTFEVTASY